MAFWQEDDDHPDRPPSYGNGGWVKDDKYVLLYDQYDIWQGWNNLKGKDAILIIEKNNYLIDDIRPYFDSIEWKKDIDVFRHDSIITPPIRSYSLYVCKNFKGMPDNAIPLTY